MNNKVSVIVSVFNTEEFLPRCLDSIMNQTYKNFELICVDDNSSDNSLSILEEYAKSNSNIKIIKNELNRGQSFCKNKALECATGDYISFVDSDDFVSSDFLEGMISVAIKKNTDIVMCDLLLEDKKLRRYNKRLLKTGSYSSLWEKLSILKNGSCCDKLFKFELIKKYNIEFPIGCLYEDNEFLLKAIYYANKIRTTQNSCYYYCYNPKSTTRKKTNHLELKNSASSILKNIINFYNTKNLTQKEYNLLLQFCIKSFCSQHIEDDDFVLPASIEKSKLLRMITRPKYKNFYQRLFSLVNITKKTKILTILFIPIRLKIKIKNEDLA